MAKTRRRRARRSRSQRSSWVLPALIVGAVVVAAGLIWVVNRSSTPSLADVTVPTPVERPYADGKALGPADAPVLVEEFSDFQ